MTQTARANWRIRDSGEVRSYGRSLALRTRPYLGIAMLTGRITRETLLGDKKIDISASTGGD
jgi:hypothetical protein